MLRPFFTNKQNGFMKTITKTAHFSTDSTKSSLNTAEKILVLATAGIVSTAAIVGYNERVRLYNKKIEMDARENKKIQQVSNNRGC